MVGTLSEQRKKNQEIFETKRRDLDSPTQPITLVLLATVLEAYSPILFSRS